MIATKKTEFGDFQTPLGLAREVVEFLRATGETADVIVEPTCGRGSFICASLAAFPKAKAVCGFDINPAYFREAEQALSRDGERKAHLECRNFFQVDWEEFFSAKSGRVLVIGNPPWVTNSALGSLRSNNLPKKTNFQGHHGFAAKTGKANFDISEWMLIRLVEALHHRAGCVAMLCKTATARKLLRHVWVNRLNVGRASLHLIFDAKRPITIDVLNRIDLKKVAEHVNRESEARRFLVGAAGYEDRHPLLVFEKRAEYRTKGSSVRRVPRRH